MLAPTIATAECTGDDIAAVNNDPSLTTLQKEKSIKDMCIGKLMSFSGEVADVKSSRIELIGAKWKYSVSLSSAHHCGALAEINKGDQLKMKGSVNRVWTALKKYNLNEGRCVPQ